MPNNIINLADRIKELSYTIGTGTISLSGPVGGFSSFSSAYAHNANIFYAATDGTDYEVGSGIYQRADYDVGDGITSNQIIRFPMKSNNSNNLVNFAEGTKEIYVTYPATHSVYMGSGISTLSVPQNSGLAFWTSNNVLNYDSNILWDIGHSYLGVNKTTPSYGIEVGGNGPKSVIKASGFIAGLSGVYFPAYNNGDNAYSGGRQLTHYAMNQLDQYAYDNSLLGGLTGSNAILQLSGVVNQFILMRKQNAGLVLAGPASGCAPPCSPAYPSFRTLVSDDIPDLSSKYVKLTNTTIATSATSGTVGQVAYDNNYLYIYPNSASGWRRIALGSTF